MDRVLIVLHIKPLLTNQNIEDGEPFLIIPKVRIWVCYLALLHSFHILELAALSQLAGGLERDLEPFLFTKDIATKDLNGFVGQIKALQAVFGTLEVLNDLFLLFLVCASGRKVVISLVAILEQYVLLREVTLL